VVFKPGDRTSVSLQSWILDVTLNGATIPSCNEAGYGTQDCLFDFHDVDDVDDVDGKAKASLANGENNEHSIDARRESQEEEGAYIGTWIPNLGMGELTRIPCINLHLPTRDSQPQCGGGGWRTKTGEW